MNLREYFCRHTSCLSTNVNSSTVEIFNSDVESDESFYSCTSDNEDIINAYNTFNTSRLKSNSSFLPPYKNALIQKFECVLNLMVEKELECFLKQIHHYNLTKIEWNKLRALSKNENIIFKPSDKGGKLVILNACDYYEMCMKHLGNKDVYLETDVTYIKKAEIDFMNLLQKGIRLHYFTKSDVDQKIIKNTQMVRLENGGKYYNAHIQEVGHDSSFVTVFIEELAEKHTVPLGNLKPVTQVTPIPAWNAIPSRRGGNYQKMSGGYVTELEFDLKARKRMFKKVRGKEVFMAVAYSRGQPVLPPRLQQTIASGRTSPIHANPGGGNMGPYEQYRPHSTPQRHGRGYAPPRSCARFINRHNLIGPEVAYYTNPGKRCYQSYDNFSYRSRSYSRSRRQMQCMNKEYQYGYVPDDEEPRGMEETITFYEIEEGDETAYPDLSSQGGSSPVVTAPAGFWVTRQGPSPLPPGKQTLTSSSEEEVDAPSESDAGYQSPSVYAAAEAASNLSIQEGVSRPSPQDGVTAYSYSQQMMVSSAVMPTSPCVTAVPVTVFSSNSPSASQATATSAISSQTSVQPLLVSPPSGGRPVMLPPVPFSFHPAPSVPVNEMGKPVPPPLPPPPYSCDPSGSDLPLDTKVVQYYFNLGLQCYHQSYWQSLVYMQQHPPMDPYAPYPEASPVVDQAVPPLYSDIGRNNDRQIPSDTAGNNSYSSIESTSIPHGPVYYPVMQDPYNPASLPGYEPCVPVIPAYHYVGAWPSVNTAYGSSPRVHSAANPGPLHQVTYVTSTNHPPNYIQQNM
ncbi:putative bifunctional UDP-N-acetylglucosamine transferase and deubiquitinase ALG13 [Protopterus annectens]|uniref:putative bifunctional UDP-N-acetylglucosamine transferase and deubiquitinase ALG13 n=1 Tax=Protopterus annectens TaxID=7888 RepID=UPI001CF9F971|nr:putative bifunctional UDP-N-acetylglucosamine transferase and deubiquitinase ALG13 [Protopterus annectens]